MVTKMHYSLVEEYKKQQYDGLLTINNVSSDKIHINKVTLPGGRVEDEYDFWGYILEKDGVKDLLPIYPEGLEDVAYRGQAYKIINDPVPAVIPPVKVLDFRGMVDSLCESQHSNPQHQILYTIVSLVQRFYRANVRMCSPPGFGKDSMIVSLSNLVGGSGAVTNPTVAKLEYMTYLNHLVINEVSSISKSDWALIQQFLLDTGDFKPSTFKRSRSSSGVGEVIDLSSLSLSLFFNDITEYTDASKFFDSKTDGNVKDRFVPFRVYGRYTEHFEDITEIDNTFFVKANFEHYRGIVSSFFYYLENINNEVHGYEQPNLEEYPERWRNNLAWILKGLDVYSKDEEEYLAWWAVLKRAIKDYEDMLSFPEYFLILVQKMAIPESVYRKGYSLESVAKYLGARLKSSSGDSRDSVSAKLSYVNKIINEPLFANKNVLCGHYNNNPRAKELHSWE